MSQLCICFIIAIYLCRVDVAKPVGGTGRRWFVVVVVGGGSGGSGNVALSGGGLGSFLGSMRGDALCSGIGGDEGFHI